MADRAKRRIKEPRRFDPDEVEDATTKARRKVKVFRKLKRRDISSELLEETVHIVWPDNGAWYGATVKQLKVRQLWAEVEYTCTGEVEQLDLGELIGDGQLAVVEEHPPGYECGKDELPFSSTLKDVDVIAAEEGGGADKDKSPDYGDEEEDEESEEEPSDSGSMDELDEAVARRKGKRRRGNPDAMARLAKRAKPAGYDDDDLSAQQQDDEEAEDAAADQKSQRFLASVTGHKPQQPGAHAADSFYGGGQAATKPKPTPVKRAPPPPISQTKSFRPQGSSDEQLRGKVRDQLQGPLATAAKELASEDGVEESAHPPPAGVAAAVEAAMHKLFGGINAQYKSKARALLFNLRDANNPQLRQRVLTGDLPPDALVKMSSEELASQELSQWRKQREQEALKASVLDEEAAAKFSTAAAVAQKQKEKQASRQRGEAATPAAEAPLGARDEATKISGSAVPEPSPSRTQAEPASPAKAADPATSSPRAFSASEAAGSPLAGIVDAKAAPVPTDWASIKAQAASGKDAAAPHIEDFEAFAGRQSGDEAWQPTSPISNSEHAGSASPLYPAYEAPAEDPHDEGRLGDQVWEGPVRGLDAVGTFGAAAYAIHGNADWGELLANPELTVKGLVRVEKLAPFFEELRSASRHRTLSLVLLRAPPASSPSASSLLAKAAAMFVKKHRAGVAEPAPELEAYFLPPGSLGDRVLRAAQEDAPTGSPVPRHLGDDEMLLAIVHPKGWKMPPAQEPAAASPEPAAAAAPVPPHSPSAATTAGTSEAAAALVLPPPPPPSPPSAVNRADQPGALGSMASPTAAAADPRRSVGDPCRAAAAAGPGGAPAAAAADPRTSAQAASATAPVAAAASAAPPAPPVSGPTSSGMSATLLADILRTAQAASSGAPAAASISSSAAASVPAASQSSQAPNASTSSASAPVLPAGMDAASIAALAAALGISTSSAAAQQPQQPAVPRPGPDAAARDPRRDPRMAAAAAASDPPPVRLGPPGPAPPYRAAPAGPGSPPQQYQSRPGRPPPPPITLPPPQTVLGPPPPRPAARPMHRAPMGGRYGGDALHQMQPLPRGGVNSYGGRGRSGGGRHPGRGRGGHGSGTGWRGSQS